MFTLYKGSVIDKQLTACNWSVCLVLSQRIPWIILWLDWLSFFTFWVRLFRGNPTKIMDEACQHLDYLALQPFQNLNITNLGHNKI